MVANTLKQITRHFCVEVAKGQFHQFNEKITDQRNIEAGTDVEHDPTLNKSNGSLGGKQYQLADQDQVDEINVLVYDTRIDD